MIAALLNMILAAFGKALAEVFRDMRRDDALRDAGRAEATAEGERKARVIQQDVTNAVATAPVGRDALADRARDGGL